MTDELPMKMRVMMFIGSMVWKAKAAVVPKWKEAMGKIRALEQEMKRLSSRVDALEGGGSKRRGGVFRRGGG